MEHILDDSKDHLILREEKLVKRRKVFRVLIFVIPILFAGYAGYFDGKVGNKIGHSFSVYLGALMIIGLLGLIIGTILSLLMWKDIHARIRHRYLVSLSTLVLHALVAAMVILNLVFFMLGWIGRASTY